MTPPQRLCHLLATSPMELLAARGTSSQQRQADSAEAAAPASEQGSTGIAADHAMVLPSGHAADCGALVEAPHPAIQAAASSLTGAASSQSWVQLASSAGEAGDEGQTPRPSASQEGHADTPGHVTFQEDGLTSNAGKALPCLISQLWLCAGECHRGPAQLHPAGR